MRHCAIDAQGTPCALILMVVQRVLTPCKAARSHGRAMHHCKRRVTLQTRRCRWRTSWCSTASGWRAWRRTRLRWPCRARPHAPPLEWHPPASCACTRPLQTSFSNKGTRSLKSACSAHVTPHPAAVFRGCVLSSCYCRTTGGLCICNTPLMCCGQAVNCAAQAHAEAVLKCFWSAPHVDALVTETLGLVTRLSCHNSALQS